MIWALMAVLAYAGAFGALLWRAPRAASVDDALVGERSLSAGALTLTLAAAWVGAATILGGAGVSYSGLSALWRSAGLWVGILLMSILAARIRGGGHRTVPEWLGARYGGAARGAAATALIVASVTLAAFQFLAAGRILQILFGAPPALGALAAAAACTASVALGGMRSTARLDRLNAGAIAGAFALACVHLGASGEAGAAMTRLRPEQLTIFGTIAPGQAVALAVATALLVLCDAGTYQKLASASRERSATFAVVGWLGFALVVEALILALSMVLAASSPSAGASGSESFIALLASGSLPRLIAAPLVAAALAIVMSAGTTFLLAAAGSLSADLAPPSVEPTLRNYRAGAAALGVASLALAVIVPGVLPHALTACSIYAAAVAPPLLASLLHVPTPRAAALASMFTGAAAAVIWEAAAGVHGAPPAGIAVLPAALAASTATLVALSRTHVSHST